MPATMDLGEEPPAVVDLLTNDWRVTPDAVPATLLDLAARDFVDLERYGPGRTVCRVRGSSGEGLEGYERMVLDHVAGLAVDGVVPAEALTTGPQDQSSRGNDRTDHFMAVDLGGPDKVKAWLVPAAVYGTFQEGEVVRATVGPRLGTSSGSKRWARGRAAGPATGTAHGEPVTARTDLGLEGDPGWVVTGEDAALALGNRSRRRGCCSSSRCRRVGCAAVSTGRCRAAGRCRCSRPAGTWQAAGGREPAVGRHGAGGDEAFLRGDTITVVRGDLAVSIRLQGDQMIDRSTALRRLAATAAGRLADRAPMDAGGARSSLTPAIALAGGRSV